MVAGGSRMLAMAAADDENVFEERFLVKWTNLSFLHCSWEGQDDLIAQVDNAKTYLTTFFRKSENGLLFDADERGDGEFFDPRYVQIERILEVVIDSEDEDEDEDDDKGSNNNKNASTEGAENNGVALSPIEKYGIVLDKDDPSFEEGTGRQFLVKWDNAPYSDCTYEFERDLILNDVEYEEHLASFLRRSKKPTKAEMTQLFSRQEEQRRRLYKIFGEKAKGSQEEKDEKIKEYQQKLQDHVFANGGQVRDYQAEGISWMISNYINKRSSILADEVSSLMKCLFTASCRSKYIPSNLPFIFNCLVDGTGQDHPDRSVRRHAGYRICQTRSVPNRCSVVDDSALVPRIFRLDESEHHCLPRLG